MKDRRAQRREVHCLLHAIPESNDSIGGNPGIRYLLVDPEDEALIQEIFAAFNMEIRRKEGTPAETTRLEQENEVLAEQADEVLRIWDPVPLLRTESLIYW